MKAFRDDVVERLSKASGLAPDVVDRSLGVPDLDRGDFAFPCFPLAKERKAPPPRIAAEIAAKVEVGGRVVRAEAVGPYVNVTVDRARLADETLAEVAARGAAYGSGTEGAGKTVVVDFSSPNVAKPLAFHHLRSTMIGNSLVRLYRARGWRTVGVNHLGDWGTGFGKLLAALELWGDAALASGDPRALNDLYVRINQQAKQDPSLEDRARAWFKRLEDGDPTARALWQRCVALSMVEFSAVYARLGVEFDHVTGESFYEDKMPAMIADLEARGLLEESEGAKVVRVEEPGDEKPMPPCLIVKSDGATLYATRDLAAAQYRHDTFRFDRCLYLVDAGQGMHFEQLKRVLRRAGRPWADALRHVPFGVLLIGGTRARTRSGAVVLLADVLDDAVEKVEAVIREKNPDLADAAAVARAVGVGAVVFSDLKNHRTNDINLDLESVLSFDGKTGPYVMYSHARACSILRKHGAALPPRPADAGARLADPTEQALVRLVARFPDRVARAVETDAPSEVATHLLDLCEAFHAYHTRGGRDAALRVLADDPTVRAARLHLVDAVRTTLAAGLALLGMGAPEQM
ncbi:MAG: arginine--tRNA ligase [Planctomycetia bacterium]|nr:arginine--tRNA ligase [Planctomycetia bacterium]